MSYTKRSYYQVKPTLKVKENIKIPRTYFDIFAKIKLQVLKKSEISQDESSSHLLDSFLNPFSIRKIEKLEF